MHVSDFTQKNEKNLKFFQRHQKVFRDESRCNAIMAMFNIDSDGKLYASTSFIWSFSATLKLQFEIATVSRLFPGLELLYKFILCYFIISVYKISHCSIAVLPVLIKSRWWSVTMQYHRLEFKLTLTPFMIPLPKFQDLGRNIVQ